MYGESIAVNLQNFKTDAGNVLRASQRILCCECGFAHFFTFEVQRFASGNWWLTMLPFAEEKTRPYKVIRRKPRAKKPRPKRRRK